MQHFDLTIVGGGMVGASLARALSNTGLSIALVEAFSHNTQQQPSYDDRAIALSASTQTILQTIGVWDRLQQHSAVIEKIHISNKGHFGFTRLEAKAMDFAAFGYVSTGHALGQALLKGLDEDEQITVFCPAKISAFEVQNDLVNINITQHDQTHSFTSQLLIAADGAQSVIRQQLGIKTRIWEYAQTAIISNITPSKASQPIAFERFTDHGPMAMLPLTEGRYGMVWTVPNDQLEEMMTLDDKSMMQRIQQHFGFRLGQIKQLGQRQSYPLQLMLANDIIHDRVVLVGNAAHTVHPITGQGFNLGLRDIAVLAEALAHAHSQQQDIGATALLSTYREARKIDHQQISLMTDGLVRLFTNPLLPIQIGRNVGLNLLDISPSMKHNVARQFMGLNSQLPRLARGLTLEKA